MTRTTTTARTLTTSRQITTSRTLTTARPTLNAPTPRITETVAVRLLENGQPRLLEN